MEVKLYIFMHVLVGFVYPRTFKHSYSGKSLNPESRAHDICAFWQGISQIDIPEVGEWSYESAYIFCVMDVVE
jgi:hypothetical protein